ncbi:MAG TPA: PKD domain-containing protein [Chitinophagales bacterium]|nr:PKD domain-containing protein [Chitinophagales bacterium]
MKNIITLLGIFILNILLAHSIVSAGIPKAEKLSITGPLGFIENKGQFLDQNNKPRTDLLYLFMRKGMKVQLMQNRISFELFTLQNDNSFDEATGFPHWNQLDPEDRPSPKLRYESSRIDVQFIGANPNPEIVAEEMMPDYLNYFLAFTPVEGITRVKQYNKITYKNLYHNIDLVLVATPDQNPQSSLAYDFVIHPGGNVSDIKYRYYGNDDQVLYENGILETGTAQGKIIEMIPESYVLNKFGVKVMPVDVSFCLNENVISFKAPAYDRNQMLVIDPALVWATYCGGDSSEEGRGLATDSLSNVALIGRSNSTNNIATAGAYQTVLAGNVDINLEKYDSAGHRIWGTYYGGSADDHGRGLVVDKQNNYYLGSHGNSPDGISTPGAYRVNYAGGTGDDGYLSEFSADGFRIFGTYYGGTDDETMRRLHIDTSGNIIMVGYTFSDSGIATPGVFQTQLSGTGYSDLCLSKWTPDGQLVWGTYLGGTNEEHGRSVTTDRNNNIYVNGSAASSGLGTAGVSRPDHAGKQDMLLARFTTDGQLDWFSYWGGAVEDRGRGVFVDSSDKYVYFAGYSGSDTGIATPGAYQETISGGLDNNGDQYQDMVLMKWTLDGHIVWSTYLGGAHLDRGRSITMIGDNEIYVSGSTESNDVVATPDAFQTVWGGKGDMFLEIFDSNGVRNYGTYFGGSGDEDNLALAVDDKHQNIYLVGTASSNNLGTAGTAQPVKGGGDDALLVKIQVHFPLVPPVASFTYLNVPCATGQVSFTNFSANADGYLWDFGDGDTTSATSPTHAYPAIGNYTVSLITTNTSNGLADTITLAITVFDNSPTATVTPESSTTFCDGQSVVLDANTGFGYTYKWKLGSTFIPGATNSSYTATLEGSYKVVITASPGCSASSTIVHVVVNPAPAATILEGPAISFCEGSISFLNANADTVTYQWLNNGVMIPGATSTELTVSSTGNYAVVETNSFSCADTSAATLVTVNANPPAFISANGDPGICVGESIDLNANTGAGFIYQWQVDGANISGATDAVYSTNQAGNYSVIVSDANGCESSSNTIDVTVNANPIVDASASNTSVCLHDSVTLSASGAQDYTWQPGNVSGQSILVSPDLPTIYIVQGTDANGCSDEDSIAIQVLPLPGISLGVDTTICDTVNFFLNAGSGFNSYLWSTGETTQTITVSASNTYWAQVQDNNGCWGIDSINVTVVVCTGAEESFSEFNISLFPNPASTSFLLTIYNSTNEKIKVELENLLGQTIRDIYDGISHDQFTKEINVNAFPAGLYYLKIMSGKEIITRKLVIEK